MTMRISLRLIVWAVIVAGGLSGGCKNDSDAPKPRVLPGRIVDIDVDSGVVTGKFYIAKQNDEVQLKGKLAPDAEILINGVTATLQDLRIGDSVTVTGWEEKRGNERNLVAKTVAVERPTTTQPAGSSTQSAPSDNDR